MTRQKNLLMILPDEPDRMSFCAQLTRDNYTRLYYSEEDGFAFLRENGDIVSAVLLDIRLARKSDFLYVRRASSDPHLASIPIVAVSPDPPSEEDMLCLEFGISDLIAAMCPWPLASKRINNAIRAKDSATFYEIEDILKKLPCNIFLKDAKGRYVFSTHYWRHIEQRGDPNWTIRGKTDMEIRKDKENAKRAYDSDMQIIATGKGTRYVIEENEDGIREYLELFKEPVYDEFGNISGIIALINDVTERELLRQKLKSLEAGEAQ